MMRRALLLLALLAGLSPLPALAQRDAAFVQPSAGGARKDSDEVIAPSPKSQDLGETAIGITKRVTLFFTNYSGRDAVIGTLSINADSSVRTEAVQNDCATIPALKPNDKCTVTVEVTPNSPGKWVAEIVAVHDGMGRVSRATLSGTTPGDAGGNGQLPGLSLVGAAKDQLIDFGDVAGGGYAVRSVLLANDSPSPLKIERISLMAANKGLMLLDKDGCSEGLEVPAGSSCPITVMWEPADGTDVSTDLIIRHTGPVGFAVIPVRGKSGAGGGKGAAVPMIAQAPMGIPALPADELFARAANESPDSGVKKARKPSTAVGTDKLSLRGTTGDQALIGLADSTVVLVGAGQSFDSGGASYRVLSIDPRSVVLETGGRHMTLGLQAPGMTITGDEGASLKPGSVASASSNASAASTGIGIAQNGSPGRADGLTGLMQSKKR